MLAIDQDGPVQLSLLPRVLDLTALHQQHPDALPFMLHSCGHADRRHRYSMLLARADQPPLLAHARSAGQAQLAADDNDNFLPRLAAAYQAAAIAPDCSELPFVGGWFVYLGYELAGEIEPVLRLPAAQQPIAAAWRCDAAVIIDHWQQQTLLVAESSAALTRLQALVETGSHCVAPDPAVLQPLRWHIEAEDGARFCANVDRIKRWIAAGDVFQVNLSRGWRARAERDIDAGQLAMLLYASLCQRNPAPFAGLANMFGGTLVSASPERLVAVHRGRVSTRPIAGTRPRGADAEQDRRLLRELLDNPKERAEHIMLIDLERNDLGRVCAAGSMVVDELMVSESYASVHHIVSNVSGRLRPGLTPVDAIAATFPGGTITGCPKVRCMQIIAALEQQPRHFYTGSMGYLSRHGSMDMNILIRSLWCQQQVVQWRCGSGIVADSDPRSELAETEAKAAGIVRSLNPLPA